MPDQYGRPQLADWAGVTSLINNVGAQRKANAAEQREVQTARLSNVMAAQPEGAAPPVDMDNLDPRVAYEASINAQAKKLNDLRFSEAKMAERARKYDQDIFDATDAFKKADAFYKSGDVEKANIFMDWAYNRVPDGTTITDRKEDVVTVASPTGVKKQFKDDLPWNQKVQMMQTLLQDPKKWVATGEARAQTIWEMNLENQLKPDVGVDPKTGKTIYRIRQIDPHDHTPSDLFYDEAGNLIKAEGSQGFLSSQTVALKKDLKDLNKVEGTTFSGVPAGDKILVKNPDGTSYVADNPWKEPEVKPSEALKEISRIRDARIKLEKGEGADLAQAVAGLGMNVQGLSDDSRAALSNIVSGKSRVIPPDLKKAMNDSLDQQEVYFQRFLPDTTRYDELSKKEAEIDKKRKEAAAKAGKGDAASAPKNAAGDGAPYEYFYDPSKGNIFPK